MFKKNASNTAIESLVGKNTEIDGNIEFAGGLRIDGRVKGNVVANPIEKSILILSETARVEGSIHAAHVILNGEILGPVHSFDLIELQPKARVLGSVFYQSLEMHYGAMINGELHHQVADKSSLLPNATPKNALTNNASPKPEVKSNDKVTLENIKAAAPSIESVRSAALPAVNKEPPK